MGKKQNNTPCEEKEAYLGPADNFGFCPIATGTPSMDTMTITLYPEAGSSPYLDDNTAIAIIVTINAHKLPDIWMLMNSSKPYRKVDGFLFSPVDAAILGAVVTMLIWSALLQHGC